MNANTTRHVERYVLVMELMFGLRVPCGILGSSELELRYVVGGRSGELEAGTMGASLSDKGAFQGGLREPSNFHAVIN